MNKIRFENLKFLKNNYLFSMELLEALEEIQDWFDYRTTIDGNSFYLSSKNENSDYDSIYDSVEKYLKDWITTLEDGMASDKNIDYSDWLSILKDPNSYKKIS